MRSRDLRRSVADLLALEPDAIASVSRRAVLRHSSHRLEDIEVELADGSRRGLIVKAVGPRGLLPAAQGVRPAFVDDPEREPAVYRDVLADAALGTPQLIGILAGPDGRLLLVLERVDGPTLAEVGEPAVWQAATRWLARLHGSCFEGAGTLAHRTRMVVHDAAYYRGWLDRAQRFAPASSPASRALRRLSQRYEEVVRRLVAIPPTVIHGEYFPSNVLVADGRSAGRICPVDWERAAHGPGLLDLASMTSGAWTAAERGALIDAYLDAVPAGAVWLPDDVPLALEACRLHLSVQWLGWTEGWTPPLEHRTDWLEQALASALELGL